jgi:hypothetical protein
MAEHLLTIWVIYRNPADFPGKWVLRGQDAIAGGGVQPHATAYVADTLEELHAQLPPGLVLLSPHPNDNPAIYETWI